MSSVHSENANQLLRLSQRSFCRLKKFQSKKYTLVVLKIENKDNKDRLGENLKYSVGNKHKVIDSNEWH